MNIHNIQNPSEHSFYGSSVLHCCLHSHSLQQLMLSQKNIHCNWHNVDVKYISVLPDVFILFATEPLEFINSKVMCSRDAVFWSKYSLKKRDASHMLFLEGVWLNPYLFQNFVCSQSCQQRCLKGQKHSSPSWISGAVVYVGLFAAYAMQYSQEVSVPYTLFCSL